MTAVSTMIAGSPPWADFAFSGLPAGTVVCRMLRQDPDGRWVLLPGSNQRPILGSEWRFIDHGLPVSVDARTVRYRIEPLSAAGAVLLSPEWTYRMLTDLTSRETSGAGALRQNRATNPYPTANTSAGWQSSSTSYPSAVDTAFVRRPGTASARSTTSAGLGTILLIARAGSSVSADTAGAIPVAAGGAYTSSAYVTASIDGFRGRIDISWHDSAGTLIGSGTAGAYTSSADSVALQWVRASYTATAPVGAAYIRVNVRVIPPGATAVGTEVAWAQDVQVELGSAMSPYFDGKMATVYADGLSFAAPAATVGHSQAWLSDPLDPLAAVLVDVMEEGRRAQWDGAGGGLLPTVGGRPPVSTGFRRWRQRDWAVAVDTPASAARVLGMIEDGGVLLLRGDPECLVHPTGVVYIAADNPELSWMLPHDTHRRYTIGGVECAPPAILQVVASRTYADDLAEHPTHADSKAAYGTYLARVRG